MIEQALPDTGPALYAAIPSFTAFTGVLDPAKYRALPDDWWIGVADVVDSRGAIAAGRYKAVNTAGAAVISAVSNSLGRRDFPFVFGGDGASFAIAPGDRPAAAAALAATAVWTREELDLKLRVALVQVSMIRASGRREVRVARYAPSDAVSYAMFSGGGLQWAERQMKAGAFHLEPAAAGTRPDLTGLSCRWQELPAANGVILSAVLSPTDGDSPQFRALVDDLLETIEASGEAKRPLPDGGPMPRLDGRGIGIEASVLRKAGQGRGSAWLDAAARTLLSFTLIRFKLSVGRFDPRKYIDELVANTDYRKYDDGLRLTLDCTPGFADRLEDRLRQAERDGLLRFGMHRQPAALMTCYTPSAMESRHFHFVDGAGGGYAFAASDMAARTGAAARAG